MPASVYRNLENDRFAGSASLQPSVQKPRRPSTATNTQVGERRAAILDYLNAQLLSGTLTSSGQVRNAKATLGVDYLSSFLDAPSCRFFCDTIRGTLSIRRSAVASLDTVETPRVKRSTTIISVVMPCLNEAETLEACIKKAKATLEEMRVRFEIVVADNGSSDGSQLIAESVGARVIEVSEKGYGAALISGIERSIGEYVVMADADDSYDFRHIPRFITQLESGADLVMGNRFGGGIRPGAMPCLHRYLGNPVLSFIGRLVFKAPCSDFHCGMRAFTETLIERMRSSILGHGVRERMVVTAAWLLIVRTDPKNSWHPDGRHGYAHSSR